MNAVTFSWASIKSRPLQSFLCIVASASGIALLTLVFLLSQAISEGFMHNAHGVDLVVGAKGSPLQLILSSVYHIDVPNANIDEQSIAQIAKNPRVENVIPLALGDNYKGHRIVGTTPDYVTLYSGKLAQGALWNKPFEAVVGASTGLATGDRFAGVHGFSGDGDDVHHFHDYKITGVLKPTGTVLDRLILTSIESVHQLHLHPDLGDPDAAEEREIGHQVTALLVKARSPIDRMNLPRSINRSTNLMAASPSYEMARLATSLGFGKGILLIMGGGFMTLSALMLLSSLASSLISRRYDLAVMRVLGASPRRLFATVMAEGMMLSTIGAITGIFVGHAIAFVITTQSSSLSGLVNPSIFLTFTGMDLGFLGVGILSGLLAALLPALSAARTDIDSLLARGRS